MNNKRKHDPDKRLFILFSQKINIFIRKKYVLIVNL